MTTVGHPTAAGVLRQLRAWLSQGRRWLPTTLLLVAALGTWWMAGQFEPSAPPAPRNGIEHPDYIVENFTTTTTDELGAIARRLSAARLLHFPETNTNELEQPRLVLMRKAGQPWNVEAERGWMSASNEVVLLLGKVHAWRDDELGARVIDIRTRDLRILPNTDYAETDQAVIIRTRRTETRGVGMRAFLDDSRVELLAQVTTTYTASAEP